MIQGKQICPAGSTPKSAERIASEQSVSERPASKRSVPVLCRKINHLLHMAPDALSGNSGAVMDKFIQYHRESRGV